MSEANSGLTGRVVDGFTNILSVKLFAHASVRRLSAARRSNGSSTPRAP
jgi:hypothetical protein